MILRIKTGFDYETQKFIKENPPDFIFLVRNIAYFCPRNKINM